RGWPKACRHSSSRPPARVTLPQNLLMSAPHVLSTASTAACTRSLRFDCANPAEGIHPVANNDAERIANFALIVIASFLRPYRGRNRRRPQLADRRAAAQSG